MSTESLLMMDSRELSFDELGGPPPEPPPLGGAGPFVINIGASSAPMTPPKEDLTSGSEAYVYTIRRNEDGRVRYRMRIGPYSCEADADAALARVRKLYPSALTATALLEDLNAIAVKMAKGRMSRPALRSVPDGGGMTNAGGAAVSGAAQVNSLAGASSAADVPAPKETLVAPRDAAPPTTILVPREAELPTNIAVPREAAAPTRVVMPKEATPVNDRVPACVVRAPVLELPELLLVDDNAPAVAAPGRPPAGTVASPAATGKPPMLDAGFEALSASLSLEEPSAQDAAARTDSAREVPLSLETTQTLRPLTSGEMRDEGALRWFVVQLSSSDRAFDPSTVPNLDIFLLYRLYSVASVDGGRTVHALRLGFFGEEMAAHAVASYLKSYYENSTVERVSMAERERFSEQGLQARKDVGETGQHAAIELSTERPAAKAGIAPAKPAQSKPVKPTAAVRAAALQQISGRQPKKEKSGGVFAWLGRRK